MNRAETTQERPAALEPQSFATADEAVAAVRAIYAAEVGRLREAFDAFAAGRVPRARVTARYPYVSVTVTRPAATDPRQSFGFVPEPGLYQTTLTRPDIFEDYYREQIDLLMLNHGTTVEVGLSETAIPIHFALGEAFHLEGELTPDLLTLVPECFDRPDLTLLDDRIANGTHRVRPGEPRPLSLFTAPRVDLSLLRLKHYTGTSAVHFQNFVLFTNYQFYIDEFVRIGRARVSEGTTGPEAWTAFVEPGNVLTRNPAIDDSANPDAHFAQGAPPPRMPQMPGYHLKRADGTGITMINIGVGPSNAKNITDHVAVLRPHAWLMLGHCAGLRNSQSLGDYVLAHGYLRQDRVLDQDLATEIPVPALAEIQVALETAVARVTGCEGYALKKVMRTGTVATVDDRNWELQPSEIQNLPLSQSRAIALDMESATVAANGFRFRVPYGTLLCVSDKPLHGHLKLPGMADRFYRERVNQHLEIGLMALELLRETGPGRLHSRKLRSFNEVAFQ